MNRYLTFLGASLALGLSLALAVVAMEPGMLFAGRAPAAITHYVAPAAACGGATPCYATIQAAVDAANTGDTIEVAGGTYTDVHSRPAPIGYAGPASVFQMVYISKTVTIRGGYALGNWDVPDPTANPTTLDAQGQGRVLLLAGSGITPIIEKLRITGGNAEGLGGCCGGYAAGGGIYVEAAAASIRDSQIFTNTAGVRDSFGGGLCLINSSAILTGNTIYGNTAEHGDGLYIDGRSPVLNHNTIRDNGDELRGWGGGVYVSYSNATLTGNTVAGNRGGYGGGINLQDSPATLSGNIITGNTSERGGGVYLYEGAATWRGNVITGNTARAQGGGVYFWHNASLLVNTVVNNNALNAAGLGAGLYVDGASTPRLLHATIAHNTGGNGVGVYVTNWSTNYGSVTMTNSIIAGHPTAGVLATAGNAVALDATLWHANAADGSGAGAINHTHDYFGDPRFAPDGYHLLAASAAIDRGVNAGVTTDIDGDARPQVAGYDLGADEFMATPGGRRKVYLPLMLRNP